MEIKELLNTGREIWAGDKLTLAQIIVRMGKVFGDISRGRGDLVEARDCGRDYIYSGRNILYHDGDGGSVKERF
ncbi:MAG: hypothetical protein WA093_05005 [Minisyncoccales bacterium]